MREALCRSSRCFGSLDEKEGDPELSPAGSQGSVQKRERGARTQLGSQCACQGLSAVNPPLTCTGAFSLREAAVPSEGKTSHTTLAAALSCVLYSCGPAWLRAVQCWMLLLLHGRSRDATRQGSDPGVEGDPSTLWGLAPLSPALPQPSAHTALAGTSSIDLGIVSQPRGPLCLH